MRAALERKAFRRTTAGLSALCMPNRLIRHYRRLDQSQKDDYSECRFTEYLLTVELRYRVGMFKAQPCYGIEIDDYLPEFEPYDSRIHRLNVELEWLLAWGISLVVDYRLSISQARGPVPDISFFQKGLQVGVEASPPRLSRLLGRAKYRCECRAYTTVNRPEVDPGHVGRRDHTGGLELEVSYRLGRIDLVAACDYERRRAHAPYSVVTDEIKDYDVIITRLGIVLRTDRIPR
ncbi:MAG: hypothetical protein ABIK43_00195 [candidate division WOR-3 bacterium]